MASVTLYTQDLFHLEKIPTSEGLVTLLHICRVVPTLQLKHRCWTLLQSPWVLQWSPHQWLQLQQCSVPQVFYMSWDTSTRFYFLMHFPWKITAHVAIRSHTMISIQRACTAWQVSDHCGRNTYFRRICFSVPNFNSKYVYMKF